MNNPIPPKAAHPAIIRQLVIERFRGIKYLKWSPATGVNLLLGGGDVGKTTVLEAIALLLNPSNSVVLSEADYFERVTNPGFCIQGVMSLPLSTDIAQQQKFAWPWEWNGKEPVPPDTTQDHIAKEGTGDPVYRVQVRGTPELEVSWEIVQPNDEIDLLSSAVRRSIGVLRLTGDDRNDRDLRLVYGSALDRLLADPGLRARIGQQVSEIDLNEKLSADAKSALDQLDQALRSSALPGGLELGLTSAQGVSIGALIGLLAEKKKGTPLPLASWGAGTRRMATLKIAAATQSSTRIAVIDEVERGLEPYRVRKLVDSLQSDSAQCFLTTHSAVAIRAATASTLWYMDMNGNIGDLKKDKVAQQQQRDPETFLTRLSIVAEGPTEVGLASFLLERGISGELLSHGVRVCDGQGTPAVLDLLEALSDAGLTFGGFVDSSSKKPEKWKALHGKLGALLFQWPSGCTEEHVIALVDDDKLLELLKGRDGRIDFDRRNTLADRLGLADKSVDAILAKTTNLRVLIVAAASGNSEGAPNSDVAKTWKKHASAWFKSEDGGRELAEKMMTLGVWPKLRPTLLPFINAVRAQVGQTNVADLQQ